MVEWLKSVISDPGIISAIKVTFTMAVCSTAISSVLGIVLGLLLERFQFPGKKIVVRFNRTLMGVPPVVVGLVVYLLIMRRGPLGPLSLLFTIKGMVIAQTLIITPHHMRDDLFLCKEDGAFDQSIRGDYGGGQMADGETDGAGDEKGNLFLHGYRIRALHQRGGGSHAGGRQYQGQNSHDDDDDLAAKEPGHIHGRSGAWSPASGHGIPIAVDMRYTPERGGGG
ncbi:MAG: hypothetical protein ACLTT1_06130 [[Clostridium] scindens]